MIAVDFPVWNMLLDSILTFVFGYVRCRSPDAIRALSVGLAYGRCCRRRLSSSASARRDPSRVDGAGVVSRFSFCDWSCGFVVDGGESPGKAAEAGVCVALASR